MTTLFMAELGGSTGSSLGRLPVASNLGSLAESPHHGLRGFPGFPRHNGQREREKSWNKSVLCLEIDQMISVQFGWIDKGLECEFNVLCGHFMGSDTWNVKQIFSVGPCSSGAFQDSCSDLCQLITTAYLGHLGPLELWNRLLGDWGAWSNPTCCRGNSVHWRFSRGWRKNGSQWSHWNGESPAVGVVCLQQQRQEHESRNGCIYIYCNYIILHTYIEVSGQSKPPCCLMIVGLVGGYTIQCIGDDHPLWESHSQPNSNPLLVGRVFPSSPSLRTFSPFDVFGAQKIAATFISYHTWDIQALSILELDMCCSSGLNFGRCSFLLCGTTPSSVPTNIPQNLGFAVDSFLESLDLELSSLNPAKK